MYNINYVLIKKIIKNEIKGITRICFSVQVAIDPLQNKEDDQ